MARISAQTPVNSAKANPSVLKVNDQKTLNVWLIQAGEPLPIEDSVRKMRTAILADKLIKRGHKVLWWTSAFDHFEKDWIFKQDTELKIKEGLKINALKGIGYKQNVSLSRFLDHRIIAWKFKKLAPEKPRPDVIVASTPAYDLAYEAVRFGKKNNIPVIVDIRDTWPDIFLEHISPQLRTLLKLALYRDFKMLEYLLKNATCLVSMMNSVLKWGLDKASREQTKCDRVFYLGAKKAEAKPVAKSSSPSPYLKDSKKFVVTFIGTFGVYSSPQILAEAAKKLIGHDIHFILGGDGTTFEDVKNTSAGLPNLTLTGWLSEDKITHILSFSDIGVFPCNNPAGAFPNRVFTYLSAGLPVISSTRGDLREIIEEYKIGLCYPPGDASALADAILKLRYDKDLCDTLSHNAKIIFDKKFDSDNIYAEYAEHIERVTETYKKTEERH